MFFPFRNSKILKFKYCFLTIYREWLTPNALQQSITAIQDRDSDTSPL